MPSIQIEAYLFRSNQDPEFRKDLLATGDDILVHVGSNAQVGIGQYADPEDPCTWGINYAGKTLMQCRMLLRHLEPCPSPKLPVLP
jgi:predicted NAD-dependent protein-ADP-ribosyltransferase YbiA (DUF1768 family)